MSRRRWVLRIIFGIFISAAMTLNACQCMLYLPLKRFQPYNPNPDGGNLNDQNPSDFIQPVDFTPVEPPPGDTQDAGPDIKIPEEPSITPEEPSVTPEEPGPPEEPIVEEPIPEIPCQDGDLRNCSTNKLGICRPGQQICQNGVWTECKSLQEPSEEVCDGLDNDCDGKIDMMRRECPYHGPPQTQNVFPCKAGSQTCINGQWSECTGEVLPKTEVCNGVDDNCDGAIDEWLPIQSVGTPTLISTQGYEAHLYLVATTTGFALGWSETGTQRVLLSHLNANATRSKTDWVVTRNGEFGNIHGLAYDGNRFAVSWDTDQGGNGGDANWVILDANSGARLLGPSLLAKGGRMVNPQVGFGLNYIGVTWSDFQNSRFYVQTFDTTGQPLNQATFFSLSSQNSPYPGQSFSGDRFGVVWNTNAGKLQFAVFDSKLNQIGQTTEIPNAGSNPSDATVAGDLNGFLVVWSDRAGGKLLGQRLDRSGQLIGQQAVIAGSGARTPIMKPTSYGGIIAWVQQQNGQEGVAIGRVGTNGQLLTAHSWFAVPNVIPYLALAWFDQGKGQGRGAIGWLDNQGNLRVAPLGCR